MVSGEEIVDTRAQTLVEQLQRRFGARIAALVGQRVTLRRALRAGQAEAAAGAPSARVRGEWVVASSRRRGRIVELSGPATQALVDLCAGSEVDVFMADLEDQLPVGWAHVLAAHAAVRAVPALGSTELLLRPRAWHTPEPRLAVGGRPVSATLFDVGVHLSHRGRAPHGRAHLYLPKIESRAEAALWRELVEVAEGLAGLPPGSVRVSVLVETLGAAVAVEELLFELRERADALNAGHADFLFSYARTFALDASRMLTGGGAQGRVEPPVVALRRRVVEVARRRGVLAVGGMTACWPVDGLPTTAQLETVRAAKAADAAEGFGASTIAHPAFAPAARAGLSRGWSPNARAGGSVLAPPHGGTVTWPVARERAALLIGYLARALEGEAPAVVDGSAEEASTAEAARVQLWTWLRHGACCDDGSALDRARVGALLDEVAAGLDHPGAERARALSRQLVLAPELAPWLEREPSAADFLYREI